MKSIVLIGFMGAGKTTVGQQLAARLRIPLIDTDELIKKETNLSIPKIFELYGESHFRKLESEMLKSVLKQNHVVSTGGGIVELKQNRDFLKQHPYTFFLKTQLTTIFNRLDGDQNRPLWNQPYIKRLELFNKRQVYYEEASNVTIETDQLTVEEIVHNILTHLCYK
ncbi:shikimate kinase [Piscibacillus salipiscarius]|uniref:Shikimate kinase n=1 Tax=Piscibacillus salipiscarius TaxID=299480 RepID=A0ABW5Q6S4_9BACI|nr:shikimate kinase [Piscibacillus salipiscarius]